MESAVCIVPFCKEGGEMLHFPVDDTLLQRWTTAIELGSGTSLTAHRETLKSSGKICQWHFEKDHPFHDPSRFWNNRLNSEVYIDHCGLCYKLDFANNLISSTATVDGSAIETLLKSVFRSQRSKPTLPTNVCQECCLRLSVFATITREFNTMQERWSLLHAETTAERERTTNGMNGKTVEKAPKLAIEQLPTDEPTESVAESNRTATNGVTVQQERESSAEKPTVPKSGFNCKRCGKLYGNRHHRDIHMGKCGRNSGKSRYDCDTCGKRFRMYKSYRNHTCVI